MRKPLLKHAQVVKLSRLLDMLYRPAELAEELGVHADTIYRGYLPAGCPHTRDENGQIWIHGPAFAEWARQTIVLKRVKRTALPDGQAWCLRCKAPVKQIDPINKPINRYLELMQSICPICGTTINRARARQFSPHPVTVSPYHSVQEGES